MPKLVGGLLHQRPLRRMPLEFPLSFADLVRHFSLVLQELLHFLQIFDIFIQVVRARGHGSQKVGTWMCRWIDAELESLSIAIRVDESQELLGYLGTIYDAFSSASA